MEASARRDGVGAGRAGDPRPGRRLPRPATDGADRPVRGHGEDRQRRPRAGAVARVRLAAGDDGHRDHRRRGAVPRPAPDRGGPGHVPADADGRGCLSCQPPFARQGGGRGDRAHPVGIARGLSRNHPDHPHSHDPVGGFRHPDVGRRAPVRHLGPAGDRVGDGACGLPGHRGARASEGAAARRCHRLRDGVAVRAPRRTGSGPDPGACGDGVPARVRPRTAPDAEVLHQAATDVDEVVAGAGGDGGRSGGDAGGARRAACEGGTAGVGGLARGGLRVRLREERRQRGAGGHPCLGHLRGDLGAGDSRNRRGIADLPAIPGGRGHEYRRGDGGPRRRDAAGLLACRVAAGRPDAPPGGALPGVRGGGPDPVLDHARGLA